MVRLYGPTPWIPRETIPNSEPIVIGSKEGQVSVVIPPDTDVHLSMYTKHTSTKIWGPDALEFRPDRFIASQDSTLPDSWIKHSSSPKLNESLVSPPLVHFSPWSLGPRVCPGLKFSQVCIVFACKEPSTDGRQVEFVAAISTLFSQARVYPLGSSVKSGSGPPPLGDEVYQTLRRTIEDSDVSITLAMVRPEDVRLVWEKRA